MIDASVLFSMVLPLNFCYFLVYFHWNFASVLA
jgi:hypothetical protein